MKVKIITFGCSNNLAESEIMAGLLKKANHEIVDRNEDIRIVNVCSVKGPSLNKGIKEIKRSDAPVVVAGCIPEGSIEKLKSIRPDLSLMNTHNIDKVVAVVEKTATGHSSEIIARGNKVKVCLPKVRKNPIVSVVPIASGCKGQCTYCSVRLIKGRLFSFDPELIAEEVKDSVSDGCKEIWLTAQDTGAYGLDIGTTLPALLNKILTIEGDFKVRLGMANPNFIHRYLDELIDIFDHPRMFKFLHIPVQAGSDKVLWQMKRPYNASQYKQIISRLKESHPDITISTDIIVGFPTETEEEYMESVKIIEETAPDVLNLSKFWLRPGTEAEELEQVPGEVIKTRSSRIKEVFEKKVREKNMRWLGWEGDILIDEKGKPGSFIGRNYAYKPVIVQGEFILGEKVKVKIKEATAHDLRA